MRNISAVSACFSGSSSVPGAIKVTTHGASNIPNPVTSSTITHSAPAT